MLRESSKSSSIAISDDDRVVVMSNPDDGSVSIFSTIDDTRTARVTTGREPFAVVIHPDNRTAFVANRGDATVVEIDGIGTPGAHVAASVDVGSEPTGLALSPTGAKLFVAEWAEGRVSVIDTASMTVTASIDGLRNPRAVAVTNNGDDSDDDETLVVTEFFGAPNPDVSGCASGSAETCDTGRIGRVLRYAVSDLSAQAPIVFAPFDSGFAPPGVEAGSAALTTSPNQLYAAAVQGQKVYVTSVSASPAPPVEFDANVFPVLYVGDLASGAEDLSNVGTADLAKLADEAAAPGQARFFLQEIVDLDFAGPTDVAYVVSRASDAVERVVYDEMTGIRVGTAAVPQIDLAPGCRAPIGIVVSNGPRAYVNCWLSRALGVVDLNDQALIDTIASTDPPAVGSPEEAVLLGKQFFFTGRGRWSEGGEGYSSCASCHPDGLSDGVTWSFPAGPRQSTSLDGSFSHGSGPQEQRVFNWTAIFDEVHDFERNTRGVSGGLGAITTAPGGQCGDLQAEQPAPLPADGLGQPVKEIQDAPDVCTNDWDDVEAFLRTIRPPRAPRGLDAAAVQRGAALFGPGNGACNGCHGGAGWTVSRRFWTPSSLANAALAGAPFSPPTDDPFWPLQQTQIAPQPALADSTGEPIGPAEVTCVLRDVGTFGAPGDAPGTDAFERKADGSRAQGAGGFNVPSLYGLSVGAPYLHHGAAPSLEDLLTNPEWRDHLQAGNPSFAPTADQVADLIAFLRSIDADTPEQPVPDGLDGCPAEFPALLADLSGDQEVPAVDSAATGKAVFFLSRDESQLSFEVDLSGIDPADILQAHLHVAPPGFNGPVVLFLASGPPDAPVLRGTLSAADLIANPDVGVQTFADFVEALRAGDVYVNVHTTAHSSGEIRGQVRAPTTFVAELEGSQEVPAVAGGASGSAAFVLSADERSLTFEVGAAGLDPSDILQAHLHVAPRGFDGPVVLFLAAHAPASLPLRGTLTEADLLANADAGIVDFADFVEALRAGDVYVNVHTPAHPGGEIRGQLRGPASFPASLSGDREVPPVASDAGGSAVVTVNAERTRLRFALSVTGLSAGDITQAHIHVAPRGFGGPVVLFLADAGFGGLRIGTLSADDLIRGPTRASPSSAT